MDRHLLQKPSIRPSIKGWRGTTTPSDKCSRHTSPLPTKWTFPFRSFEAADEGQFVRYPGLKGTSSRTKGSFEGKVPAGNRISVSFDPRSGSFQSIFLSFSAAVS